MARHPNAGRCECGKIRYVSRKIARRAAKQRGQTLRVYQCGEFWHLTSVSMSRIADLRRGTDPG